MSYKKTIQSETLHFLLEREITVEVAHDLATEIAQEMNQSEALRKVVIDLNGMHGFRPDSMRIFSPLGLELRRQERHIHVVNAPKAAKSLIAQMGMELILRVAPEVHEAAVKPKSKIDVRLVNPFISGVMHVLEVQCSTPARPGHPVLKAGFQSPSKIDIAGVIAINNASFHGSIALCFSEKMFLGLMSTMLGEKYEKLTPDLMDGAGELLNMIFGYAKQILNGSGLPLGMAIPTVVSGDDIAVRHTLVDQAIVLPFTSDLGDFYIEIGTAPAVEVALKTAA